MHHLKIRNGVPALVLAIVWGCSGGGGSPTAPSAPPAAPAAPVAPAPSAPATSTVSVAIVGSAGIGAFQPNPVRANTGDTVMFRNNDSVVHRLVMDDGSGDLGDIAPGGTSRGFVLRSAAATAFHCTLHATMVGSINGEVEPPPACVPDIYGYGC